MKKLIYQATLLISLCFLNSCGGSTEQQPGQAVRARLASVISDADPESATFQTLQGQALELELFSGQKVFLNYWATWCVPCIQEIPTIINAQAALEAENYVFLLASDESLDTIRQFIEDREFDANFIKLNPWFGSVGIDALPASVLFDENGEMIKAWNGAYEWDTPEMLSELRNSN